MVTGAPGIGKTALADELTRRARQAGVTTCWGGCLEGGGAPAYLPWTRVLAGLGAPDTLLNPAAGTRYRLFDEVVGLLRERAAAARAGMLVVLDDLHWADVPSMRLLQELAPAVRDSRLLAVGLYRPDGIDPDGEPGRVLSAVLRERATTPLTLGGLAPAEVAELAARTLDRPPDETLLAEVRRRAEGNPLFVVELVRLAGSTGGRTGDAPLPAGVREVIAWRLDRLPPATRELLRAAAVLGRDFATAPLAEIAGLPGPEVADLLAPAVAADLVDGGGGGTW